MTNDHLIPISMIRTDLDDLPDYEPPARYTIQWYKEGDEEHWVSIHKQADDFNNISLNLFRKIFGSDIELLKQRQCYLIAPEMQGIGLFKSLLSCICNRLRVFNHNQAYLTTLSIRLPAINLYYQFGFIPDIRSIQDQEIWENLNKIITNKK